ncbi:MAG TPA: Zn-ribbon domain-containing OB-fold protein [Vicinamibacteria bacterium]
MDLARYHRLRAAYSRLEGQRCLGCRALQFPPRASCRACGQAALEPHGFSGRGEVFSHAEVGQPPAGFEGPYLVALVRLEEGPLVTAQLTDVEAADVHVGLPVEMVTRRLQEKGPEGLIVYGYKFRPRL